MQFTLSGAVSHTLLERGAAKARCHNAQKAHPSMFEMGLSHHLHWQKKKETKPCLHWLSVWHQLQAKNPPRLLGILSEDAMKMNTFPEVNMVGMEKDRLQGVDTDVESNNCQSYEEKCCDFLLDVGYGKPDVLTHAKYCLLVLVFSAAAHLNFRLSFLQSFSKLLKQLRPAFL